jgi:hypothetical protein
MERCPTGERGLKIKSVWFEVLKLAYMIVFSFYLVIIHLANYSLTVFFVNSLYLVFNACVQIFEVMRVKV